MSALDHMILTILTPEHTLLESKVSRVELPGSKGRFVVLRNHAPVITSLTEGEVVYMAGCEEGRVRILSGFAEVKDNVITVCAEI